MMLFTSCKNQQEKLINNANSYIANNFVQNMDNPKSYEFVKTSILDTFTNRDSYQKIILNNFYKNCNVKRDKQFDSLNKINYFGFNGFDFNKNYSLWQKNIQKMEHDGVDSIIYKCKTLPSDTIYYINLRHIFRGQNKFGAIILDTINIQYNYHNKSFNIK